MSDQPPKHMPHSPQSADDKVVRTRVGATFVAEGGGLIWSNKVTYRDAKGDTLIQTSWGAVGAKNFGRGDGEGGHYGAEEVISSAEPPKLVELECKTHGPKNHQDLFIRAQQLQKPFLEEAIVGNASHSHQVHVFKGASPLANLCNDVTSDAGYQHEIALQEQSRKQAIYTRLLEAKGIKDSNFAVFGLDVQSIAMHDAIDRVSDVHTSFDNEQAKLLALAQAVKVLTGTHGIQAAADAIGHAKNPFDTQGRNEGRYQHAKQEVIQELQKAQVKFQPQDVDVIVQAAVPISKEAIRSSSDFFIKR